MPATRIRTSVARPAAQVVGVLALLLLAGPAFGQDRDDLPSPDALKQLSMEELMNLEVTSVSRRPELLSETASAIQLVTNVAIRRSGAVRLPEALRLAPNLMVAQVNAHDWAVTARGFNGAPLANNSLADKLLVMIDGRTVYTPLFGGVFWDVQNVLMEDLDRIEVVSGPGGTLWGANAVNGVINVITKGARDTQGVYATAALGSFLQDHVALRYGGRAGKGLYYRVYGQRFDYGSTALPDGGDAADGWNLTQSGFRLDYDAADADRLTLEGNVYGGSEEDPVANRIDGQNVLLRWTRTASAASDLSLQAYFDRTWRKLPGPGFGDALRTYDVDFQHRFPLAGRHSLVWGIGYRFMQDDVNNSTPLSFLPARHDLHLFSAFVQDDVAVVRDRLQLTLGTKLEHNGYSGFEVQPGVRLAWTPVTWHTVWAAVSRAIRSPSRFDADLLTPNIVGDPSFASENLLACEAGYRLRPTDALSLSLTAFYHRYDDVRSINLNPSAPPALVFANDQNARSGGFEATATYQATGAWRLRGGYTYLDKIVSAASPAVLAGSDTFEGIDPRHQVVLQSMLDLPGRFQFDVVGRYVDVLPATAVTPRVPPYATFDVRLAWVYAAWEVAVVGKDLAESVHPEFGRQQIPRSIHARLTWRH